MKLSVIYKELIAEMALSCVKNGITFILSNTKEVKLQDESKEFKSSGFFAEEEKILSVGTKKPIKEWFPTLLHEYNHMIQWLEEAFVEDKHLSAYELFWDWLDNKCELDKDKLRNVINIVRDIEKDCEYRTWTMLKDNPELKISPDGYIKKANSYLYSFALMRRKRQWLKKPPYRIKRAVEIMPAKFMKDYNRVPKEFQELILKECFR